MQAEEALRVEQAELACDHRAIVGSVHAVALVAETPHERVVGPGDPRGRPPALGHGLREAVTGRVRDDDVEGVLGTSSVRDRVDEAVDHVEVVDRGSGVGVQQQQGRGALVRGADVDEVDVLAVDPGDEVRERVDACLGGAPVEGAPGGERLTEVVVRGAGGPVVGGRRLRQAGPGQAVLQVGDLGIGDGDGEGAGAKAAVLFMPSTL